MPPNFLFLNCCSHFFFVPSDSRHPPGGGQPRLLQVRESLEVPHFKRLLRHLSVHPNRANEGSSTVRSTVRALRTGRQSLPTIAVDSSAASCLSSSAVPASARDSPDCTRVDSPESRTVFRSSYTHLLPHILPMMIPCLTSASGSGATRWEGTSPAGASGAPEATCYGPDAGWWKSTRLLSAGPALSLGGAQSLHSLP